jgi:hypothetical protein
LIEGSPPVHVRGARFSRSVDRSLRCSAAAAAFPSFDSGSRRKKSAPTIPISATPTAIPTFMSRCIVMVLKVCGTARMETLRSAFGIDHRARAGREPRAKLEEKTRPAPQN